MLAAKVGEEATVDMKVVSTNNGDFYRARVLLVAAKSLVRFVTLTPEGCESSVLQIKYEKIPQYYAHCGLMGHVYLECGAGEYAEEELQFGTWMIAPEFTWRPGTQFRNYVPPERAPSGTRSERD